MLHTVTTHNHIPTAPAFQPIVSNVVPSLSFGYFLILGPKYKVGLILVLQMEK